MVNDQLIALHKTSLELGRFDFKCRTRSDSDGMLNTSQRKPGLTLVICLFCLAPLVSCNERIPNLDRNIQPSYGVKIKYAERKPLRFPDFTIEFIGQKPPRFYERYPRQEFRITGAVEVQEVSWGRDRGMSAG